MTGQEIRQSLLAADPEFRRLVEEHSRCELQLDQILHSVYLSSEDLIQESLLKKRKLRLKDQMEQIISDHRHWVEH